MVSYSGAPLIAPQPQVYAQERVVFPPPSRTVSDDLFPSDDDDFSLDEFLVEIDKSFDFNLDAVDNDDDLGRLLDDIAA